ncbi:Serine/threonine-protein phosphatase 7 long form homolog, partial [Linum grandiflorum]
TKSNIAPYHAGYERVLLDVGLFPIVEVSHLVPDMELCTALIVQWRPETNTFHMYHGEMTIMLEDVSFMTSLPVDGGAVFQEYPAKDYD